MKLAYLALAAVMIVHPAFAQPAANAGNAYQDESQLMEHGAYINSDGRSVHRPAHTKSGKAPPGATAQCRDASYSFSQHRRGTCSGHGGVLAWL